MAVYKQSTMTWKDRAWSDKPLGRAQILFGIRDTSTWSLNEVNISLLRTTPSFKQTQISIRDGSGASPFLDAFDVKYMKTRAAGPHGVLALYRVTADHAFVALVEKLSRQGIGHLIIQTLIQWGFYVAIPVKTLTQMAKMNSSLVVDFQRSTLTLLGRLLFGLLNSRSRHHADLGVSYITLVVTGKRGAVGGL